MADVSIEISLYDDGSTDGTWDVCREFLQTQYTRGPVVMSRGEESHGAGFARNRAIEQATGEYLCWQDSDDVSLDNRLQEQLDLVRQFGENALVGSRFIRLPPTSTWHYSQFLNTLSDEDLVLKSFRELTLIQPTWFMSRRLFDKVGMYREGQLAEDLEWFHRCLDLVASHKRSKGQDELGRVRLVQCSKPLLLYRHLPGNCLSSSTPRKLLVEIRIRALERRVLCHWPQFSIWGAGRDGKLFFQLLHEDFRKRVVCFGDVDANKIGTVYKEQVPVVHFSQLTAPFIVCVAMGRTGGELEQNIASLGLREGEAFWHFF